MITYSIFPKFQNHLDPRGLAALVKACGVDTTNLVVRDGYWCQPKTLAHDVPAFVRAMAAEGLTVRFATAGWSAEEILKNPDWLRLLVDHGVAEFRMGYFRAGDDPVASFTAARDAMKRIADTCLTHRIRAVYQVHHGTLIASPSAALRLVEGLPPPAIGVELDPGNQTFEGHENFLTSMRLLGPYFVAAGVKDSAVTRDPAKAHEPAKGWRRDWVPCNEGVVNWHAFADACRQVAFTGILVFMPFYNEKDPATQARRLKEEVAYVRRAFA
jgi:sugar phosphate isomerase/epimerase